MTELANYGGLGGLVQKVDQSVIEAVTRSGDWLPRLTVTTGMTGLVADGKINVGRIALIKDKNNFKDLGTEIEALALGFHPRAMRTAGGVPLSYYSLGSPEFQKIISDSETPNSNAFFGPEFLVWLPSENLFCLMFCSSKTARQDAGAVVALMGEGRGENEFGPAPFRGVVRVVRNEAKKQTWHSWAFSKMSTPLPAPTEVFTENLNQMITDFNNPQDSKIETASPAGERAR